MLTATATVAPHGLLTLSAPNGPRTLAWRTASGARLSAYVTTADEAARALARIVRLSA